MNSGKRNQEFQGMVKKGFGRTRQATTTRVVTDEVAPIAVKVKKSAEFTTLWVGLQSDNPMLTDHLSD